MEEKATEPGKVEKTSQAKPCLRIDTDQKVNVMYTVFLANLK